MWRYFSEWGEVRCVRLENRASWIDVSRRLTIWPFNPATNEQVLYDTFVWRVRYGAFDLRTGPPELSQDGWQFDLSRLQTSKFCTMLLYDEFDLLVCMRNFDNCFDEKCVCRSTILFIWIKYNVIWMTCKIAIGQKLSLKLFKLTHFPRINHVNKLARLSCSPQLLKAPGVTSLLFG